MRMQSQGSEEGQEEDLCAWCLCLIHDWSRQMLLCAGVRQRWGEGRGCKSSSSAQLLLFSPSLLDWQLRRNPQGYSLSDKSWREVNKQLNISWKSQSPFGAHACVSLIGPAFLGCCLRARTDPAAASHSPVTAKGPWEGCLLNSPGPPEVKE